MVGAVKRVDPLWPQVQYLHAASTVWLVSVSINHISSLFWFQEIDAVGLYSPDEDGKAAVCSDSPNRTGQLTDCSHDFDLIYKTRIIFFRMQIIHLQ